MPTLNWIGKDAVVKHHKEVPFRMLQPVAELSYGEASHPENENLIVQGDNLHALKALLPRYAGKVKCIYIDPPYNTGNEGWVYNDNVNSPEIKRWLGEVVGKEGETLDRHDRWLCMMYPRLLLLKQFLRNDGVIFVSLDDNEQANMRLLMNEVFGEGAFLSQNVVMRSKNGMGSDSGYSRCHDYIITYKKSPNSNPIHRGIIASDEYLKKYKFEDKYGRYKVDGLFRKKGDGSKKEDAPNCFYPVYYDPVSLEVSLTNLPNSIEVLPKLPNGQNGRWIWSKSFAAGKEFRLLAGKQGKGTIYVKDYATEIPREKPRSVLLKTDYLTERATEEMKNIFGDKAFPTPKPVQLIIDLLDNYTNGDDIVLDSFGGSGTTAEAVLKLNSLDSGKRSFILVEMDENIAQNVTAERVKRVVQGYSNANGEVVAGLGDCFQFCILSKEPLFTAEGQIRSDVSFAELAEFVWFTETGTGYPKGIKPSPLLGVHQGKAVYLLFNGILKDRGDLGGNVLNNRTLAVLPEHDGQRVVYGARTRFDKAKLSRMNIEFKQLPYELTVKSWV